MLRLLPLLAGILPLVAMFGAFWLGVANDVLPPDCNPVLDGCRSISATGRNPPGSFLFRAIMLPQAALLGFVWYLSVLWLRRLQAGLGQSMAAAILIAGLVNVVALALYVTFLGTSEPLYEFMRRSGIYFGFLGMATAQTLIAIALIKNARRGNNKTLARLGRAMLSICVVVLLLGVLNSVLKSILVDADASENRIEWIAAILMQSYFFLLFAAWRTTGIDISVRVGPA